MAFATQAKFDALAAELSDELPERPEPEVDPPSEEEWLFDSERSYTEQLPFYHAQRGGGLQDGKLVSHRAQSKPKAQTTYTKTCVSCGAEFEALRKKRETCSDACRVRIVRSRAAEEQRGRSPA